MAKPLPRTPYLNPRFSAAMLEFAAALKKSSSINHKGDKGKAREEALRIFFKERLPEKYSVVEGEVVDLMGNTSPQLDIMFYDQSVDFAFNSDQTKILPAEALLASIEVKSRLNSDEISKSISAAKKLRSLKPFNRTLNGKKATAVKNSKQARYYHCLFAYGTDLSEKDWLENEFNRFQSLCGNNHLFDSIFILNKGIINLPHKIGRLEDEEGGAIASFYFSILNFIQREAKRRPETPFERYVTHEQEKWKHLK